MTDASIREQINDLKDLQKEIQNWRLSLSEHVREAESMQQSLQRDISDLGQRLAHETHESEEVQALCITQKTNAETVISDTDEALDTTQSTLMDASDVLAFAQNTLAEWQNRLEIERSQLEQAHQALANAERVHQSALAELADAQAALSSAQSRLSSARNNSERKDTSYEQGAVSAAQVRVIQAIAEVQVAEQQVMACQERVSIYERNVAQCELAVSISQDAVDVAADAVETARNALDDAQHATELADDMEHIIDEVDKLGEQRKEYLEDAREQSSQIEQLVENMCSQVENLSRAQNDAQELGLGAETELSRAIEDWEDVNRPTDELDVSLAMPLIQSVNSFMGHVSQLVGEIAEKKGPSILKRLGCEEIHSVKYSGNQGLDLVGTKQTPKGYDGITLEIKGTLHEANLSKSPRSRLRIGADNLQQGSKAYAIDRLEQASNRGSRNARMLLRRMNSTRPDRIHMLTHYVAQVGVPSSNITVWRAYSGNQPHRVGELRPVLLR